MSMTSKKQKEHPMKKRRRSSIELIRRWSSKMLGIGDARPDEPNLFSLPSDLHATYRRIPSALRCLVCILAAVFVHQLWFKDSGKFFQDEGGYDFHSLVKFAVMTYVIDFISTLLVQDMFFAPSRIDTMDLKMKYFPPSPMSRFQIVSISDEKLLDVHFLEYIDKQKKQREATGSGDAPTAIYLNHGFGASSLSWLPTIPYLAEKLNAASVRGHDKCGFGFSERPEWQDAYSSATSAQVASSLFRYEKNERVVLIGHSMGSFCTLQMVSSIPDDVPLSIVLVAPALGFPRLPKMEVPLMNSDLAKFTTRNIIDPPLRYCLRRLVGLKKFWKNGLRMVWGDRTKLTESDALRFQWPAIGHGWEQGILNFVRNMPNLPDAAELLQRVASRPNTRILVIRGTKDKVITKGMMDSIFADYQNSSNMSFVDMPGLGHDPFEEDVQSFVDIVAKWFSSKET